jgi:branched-chain amino acid transport system permease protein
MGEPIPKYDIVLLIITPFIALALWYVITRTRLGVLVRAATQDREMVGALGVNQAWLFTGVFALGSALAGSAGPCNCPRAARPADGFHDPDAGLRRGRDRRHGLAARGLSGGVIISVLNVFGVTYVPQSTLVLMFVVMIVVLMIRPYGLLGREEVAGEHGQVGEPESRSSPPPARCARWSAGLAVLALMPLLRRAISRWC